MFTGLVTEVGAVKAVRRSGGRIVVAAPYRGLEKGESIAVDGACLTVVATGKGTFSVDVIPSTLGRTHIGDYVVGTRVNLERALRPTDRLGGHLVAGHVDGVGTIRKRTAKGDSVLLDIEVPAEVRELCVPHGSIAVDGVSLTINKLPKGRLVQVALIPHTLAVTTLGGAAIGGRVHLEADLIGKFVRQLVQPYRASRRREP